LGDKGKKRRRYDTWRLYMPEERKRSRSELITELTSLRLKVADFEHFRLQHQQTERDLTQKKKEYRTIFDSVPARVMYLDGEGRVLRANNIAARSVDLKAEDIIGKSLRDFFPAEEASRHVAEHKQIISSGKARFGIVEQFITTKGKSRWLRVDKIPYQDAEQHTIGIIVLAIDITHQKRTEDALQEAEERFRHFMEHVPIYVFFKDDKSRSLQLSRNYEKMLGRSIEDLIGTTMDDLFPSDLAKSMIEDDKRVLREGKPIEVEEEFNGRFYTTTKFPLMREGKPPLLAGFTMDITNRKLSEAAMQENIRKLRKLLGNTIQVISSMIKAKAPFTADHQIRVANLARTIAKEMGLSSDQIESIMVAGSLHDLGMIGVPGEILSSPRRLTDHEFELVKVHPTVAYDILKNVDFPWPIADIIVQHHERLDGSGYPHGIQGETILLDARILAVADVVESIASHRPYRPAMDIDQALEIIVSGKGTLFDPAVVDTCVRLFRDEGFQLKE
jgi:PAS domain S-box-containing protein